MAGTGSICARQVSEWCVVSFVKQRAAIEISLMCPNLLRPGERFDDIGLLNGVLERIAARRKPVIVRVPNDTARTADRLAEMIERCVESGVEGLKVGGGRPVAQPRLGGKQGR